MSDSNELENEKENESEKEKQDNLNAELKNEMEEKSKEPSDGKKVNGNLEKEMKCEDEKLEQKNNKSIKERNANEKSSLFQSKVELLDEIRREFEKSAEPAKKSKHDLKQNKIRSEEKLLKSSKTERIKDKVGATKLKKDKNEGQVAKEKGKENEESTSESKSPDDLSEKDKKESTDGTLRKVSVSESELYVKKNSIEKGKYTVFSEKPGRLVSFEEKIKFDTFLRKLSAPRSVDERDEKEKIEDDSGGGKLSTIKATILSLAAIIGAGLSELPGALQKSGWYGVFIFLLVGIDSLYAGLCIGWCWIIIEERWPEYRADNRSPYPTIGLKAVGKWMKYIAGVCMHLKLLTSCIAYLSLIASAFVEMVDFQANVCIIMLCVILLSMPFIVFVQLRKLWWMGFIDLAASVSLFLLIIGALFVDKMKFGDAQYASTSMSDLGFAFGVVAFAFGAGGVHPTIQNEMKNKKCFPQAVATSYLIILVLYVPLPILGYAAYGEATKRDILNNFRGNENLNVTRRLLALLNICHLAATLMIYLNPIFQNVEDVLNLSKKLDIKVCFARIAILVFVLIMGLTMPFFGTLVPLVGAFLSTFVNIVLPPIFYICLVQQKNDNFPPRHISIKEWVMLVQAIGVGILAGCYGTYASFGIWKSEKLQWFCFESVPQTVV